MITRLPPGHRPRVREEAALVMPPPVVVEATPAPTITFLYVTARKEPKIEWFFESLHREVGGDFHDNGDGTVSPLMGDYAGLHLIVVDHHLHTRILDWSMCGLPAAQTMHVVPKPTRWSGPHRATKEDYFSKANTLNTGLCLADEGWIAIVDDLTVLMPGFLSAVREAIAQNRITAGAYEKRSNMIVEKGVVVSSQDHPGGKDNRWIHGKDHKAVPALHSAWTYGSLVAPIGAFLEIGGYSEELTDGTAYEDSQLGLMWEKHGYQIFYDRRMLHWESEELHHIGPAPRREDWGVSPKDKSHAQLDIISMLGRDDQLPNSHLDEFGGIRGIRERVRRGEPFPVPTKPETEWFTGRRLEDL